MTDWIDTAGIAALLGQNREHVANRVVKRPGFPKPTVDLSQKTRRWDRDAVVAYLTSKPRRGGRPRQS